MINLLLNSYLALPKGLRIFLFLACCLTSASLLTALVWRAYGYGLPYASAYYFVPNDLFQDFQGFRPRFRLFGTPAFFTKFPSDYAMYPAPLLFPIAAFMQNVHPIRTFLIFTISVVLCCSYLLYKALRSSGLGAGPARLFISGHLDYVLSSSLFASKGQSRSTGLGADHTRYSAFLPATLHVVRRRPRPSYSLKVVPFYIPESLPYKAAIS